MINTSFAHVALNCCDMAVTERFYGRYFGFRRARVIDLGAEQIIFLKLGNMYLELFQAKGEAPVAPPANDGYGWPSVRHLAFQVNDVAAKLAEIGDHAQINLGPLEFNDFIPGWKTVWIRDPDGNVVEISQGFTDQTNPPTAAIDCKEESLVTV